MVDETRPLPPQAGAPPPVPLPSPFGTQEIRKLDLQMALQDNATLQKMLSEERRYAERRLADERERSRYEQGRIRTELGERIEEGKREIEVLVRTLGRVQAENDHIREALAVARAEKGHQKEGPEEDIVTQARQRLAEVQQRINRSQIQITPGFSPREPILGGIPVKLVEPHDPQMPQGAP